MACRKSYRPCDYLVWEMRNLWTIKERPSGSFNSRICHFSAVLLVPFIPGQQRYSCWWVSYLPIAYTIGPMTQQPTVGQDLLIIEALRSHSDTTHSIGFLWTSDRSDAETSTWQHITLTTDIHAHGGIRTRNPSKRWAADPRLRPHGHWGRSDCAYLLP